MHKAECSGFKRTECIKEVKLSGSTRPCCHVSLLQLPQELEKSEMLKLTEAEERFPSSWEPGGPVPASVPNPAQVKG